MAMTRDSAEWLSFAASPICAVMAWGSAAGDAGLCMTSPGHAPMNGMAAMYLLMSVFHLPPWLRLIGRIGETKRQEKQQ